MPDVEQIDSNWQQYDQRTVWHRTHKALLKKVKPEVIAAANAASKTRFINTKYLCEEVQENPHAYPNLAKMSIRAMKGTISLCCTDVLQWSARTNHCNHYGGRIFVRTDR